MNSTDQQSNDSSSADKSGSASQRLLSLDVFRGLTILAMILVNNPGSWSNLYGPVAHAPWHGWTPTDLIFPFFLFIVGTSLAYSLRRFVADGQIDQTVYWRIFRRTFLLILLGLLLNFSGEIFRYLLGQSEAIDLSNLRVPGVLQRIALVYCAASLIVLHLNRRAQVVLAVVLLLGYWGLCGWMPNPDDYQQNLTNTGNFQRIFDQAVFGANHLYTQGRSEPTDPEGLLSTLPAVVTTLLGYWTGLLIQRGSPNRRTVGMLVAGGLVCAAVGLAWDLAFPINKKLWTSSYVMLSGGLAMISLAVCLWLFDVAGWRRLARPFQIVGVNAIAVFVASGLMGRFLVTYQVGEVSLKAWLYSNLFADHLADPRLASLAYAASVVAFWWLILWALAARGWSIRV